MASQLLHQGEILLTMQDCGVMTDSATLQEAIRVAHHEPQFRTLHRSFHKYFQGLAETMRARYPECRCGVCRWNRAGGKQWKKKRSRDE